jgi:hypothetical protein
MASPVVTVVEDRDDEPPPYVYGALVGALSRGDAHIVHALLLDNGLGVEGKAAEGRDTGIFGDMVDGYLGGEERRCSSLSLMSVESSVKSFVFEAIKRVLEVLFAYHLSSRDTYYLRMYMNIYSHPGFDLSVLYVHHCGDCICGELVLQSKEGWSALTLAVQRGDDGILQDVLHTAGRLFDEVRYHP